MELAYLGLFSKIFNWVLDRIFDPIFKWLSGLLNTVFTWIFEEILAPILLPILEKALDYLIELYMDIYGAFIYGMFSGLLKLIDYMETAFDVFIGIRDVKYYPNPSVPGNYIEGSLVEVLLQQETVSTVFWLLTAAGLAIALMLTIFATAKSSFDLDFDNTRPVSKVLTALMKTFIQFFMVPFFVYFMLMLSAEILKIASTAISGDTPTTLGRIVFVVASLNAANENYVNHNAWKNPSIQPTADPNDIRFPFYITQPTNGKTPLDYTNLDTVKKYFDFSEFDYLIGMLAAIFLLFVMAVCLITFVQRVFEIVLLYIVSPYFVSMMPLDDGERFGRWRDMFIGKCFTGFGSAIGMRLYLLVCQMIMGNTIRFSNVTVGSSIEMDYIMKLFFLVGGAWAVFKSGPMITGLVSAGAGQRESETQHLAGASLYGHTIGKAMNVGKGAMMSAFRGGSGAGALARDRKAKNADPNQKFEGGKGDRMAKASQDKGTQTWKKGVTPTGARAGKFTVGAKRSAAANEGKIQVRPRSNAMSRDPKMMEAARAATAAAGLTTGPGLATSTTSADTAYKEKKNFRLGSMIQSTYDDKGNHKVRVLGFGVDKDSSGKTMSFKMPIAGFKVQRTDPTESMKLARMHIPGITKIDSNVQGGKLQYSDISVLHGAVRYRSDESGSRTRVLGGLATHSTDKEGSHTSVLGIHGHSYTEGGGGFDTFGGHLSIKTNSEHVQSVKVGALEYSRSGITKKTPPGGK